MPRTPVALYEELASRIAALPERARVLLDGVDAQTVAAGVVALLPARGRLPLQVHGADFLRPAGVRLEYGRQDAEALRTVWLDGATLRREVVTSGERYLPALWDATRDRSARAVPAPVPAAGVIVVDGVFMLGLDLPADLVVHVTMSEAALRRRDVPEWQLPAFRTYDEQVRPGEKCDLLIRAEDPKRPAARWT